MRRGRGYHSLASSFGKVFHVEKRWKLIREMGAGAYGVVMYVPTGSISTTVIHSLRHLVIVPLLMKYPERPSL